MVAPLVLVVEDDPLSLKLMRDVLAANGYETREAMTGPDAVAAVAAACPDLVVMDIGLPGFDGVEATKRIKAACRAPVIAVTAYAMPSDEERMRAAGSDAYLTKPLRFADLLRVLDGLLAQDARSGSEK